MKAILRGGFRLGPLAALCVGFTLVLLTGCVLQTPVGKSFSGRLATGYTAVTSVRQGTLTLLQAHEISPQDAQKAQDKADQARGFLDLASRLYAGNEKAGGDALEAALSALAGIQGCVNQRTGFANCIDEVELRGVTP